MEFRPVPDAHDDAFEAALAYAFAPERGPDPDRDGPGRPDSFRPRGLYDVPEGSDGEPSPSDLAAVCGYYDLSARIRGEFCPVAGVSAVASPPEYRRRGLVRELLTDLHRECRDEGIPLAALWPFEFPFYRRLGYARVNDYTRTVVPVDALDGACADPAGEFERLSADDWERLDDVYAEWATGPLGLDRTEGWWRRRVFESWGTDPYVYGWRADADVGGSGEADDLRGYLVYTIEDGDEDGRSMEVSELAFRDREARGQLLRFCRNHDSQVERVRLVGPPDVHLLDELDDPRAAETERRAGPMARVVDVAGALETIDYPRAAEGAVTVDVTDDTCPWNDGTYRLRVADGHGRVDAVRDGADAAVSLDVGALTRLVVGSHGVDRLVELGDVTVVDGTTRRTLAAAFPPAEPYLREGF
ncbi:GNAT family N-acetyltransferase [Halobaculum sp. EA56]|uniref:GNAT family N-acetyltransferase n=1 Tax=Halobaculum sp. EA56 TaxID=3421648 RepID=UPI003EBE1EEF